MNPAEIIKVAPELTQDLVKLAGAILGSDFAKRILGPALDEYGEVAKDRVRLYRFGRQLKCLEKAAKMARDAGFTPKAVPIKLLFPLLEGASFEEDEALHDMWAALLANASSPDGEKVRPGFISILKETAADEAALLKTVAELTDEYMIAWARSFPSKAALDEAKETANAAHMNRIYQRFVARYAESDPEARISTCRLILEHRGLIDYREVILLSSMGISFLNACEPPKPKP